MRIVFGDADSSNLRQFNSSNHIAEPVAAFL
jgi:hypothetical protein